MTTDELQITERLINEGWCQIDNVLLLSDAPVLVQYLAEDYFYHRYRGVYFEMQWADHVSLDWMVSQ